MLTRFQSGSENISPIPCPSAVMRVSLILYFFYKYGLHSLSTCFCQFLIESEVTFGRGISFDDDFSFRMFFHVNGYTFHIRQLGSINTDFPCLKVMMDSGMRLVFTTVSMLAAWVLQSASSFCKLLACCTALLSCMSLSLSCDRRRLTALFSSPTSTGS